MNNLLKALAEFQHEVPTIQKNTTGYGYKYADLPTIFDVIKPLLKKHGLGFFQHLGTLDGVTYLQTTIYHVESGEKIDSQVEIPNVQLAKMNDYQAFGSGVTYYRRYALACSLTLITDVDNDGAGQQTGRKKGDKAPKKQGLNDAQFEKACNAIVEGAYTAEALKAEFQLTQDQIKIVDAL